MIRKFQNFFSRELSLVVMEYWHKGEYIELAKILHQATHFNPLFIRNENHLCHPFVILPPPCHNRPSRGPRLRAPLWLQPPPAFTACPGRAVRCCGPLQRAAHAVVTGEHSGRATGGATRKGRLFYLSVLGPIRSLPATG